MDGDNDKLPQSLVECSSRPSPGPQTHEEIKAFNDGFKAGLTAYACAVGHSGLRSENEKLRELMDEQGWKTIEMFEIINKAS